jgi:hypothetical protein
MATHTMPREVSPDTVGESAAIAELHAGYELLAAAYRETTRRYDYLRTAAQAAVVESRTSVRNPVTPVSEALVVLDEMPAPDARLRDLPLLTTLAWPAGSEVEP